MILILKLNKQFIQVNKNYCSVLNQKVLTNICFLYISHLYDVKNIGVKRFSRIRLT